MRDSSSWASSSTFSYTFGVYGGKRVNSATGLAAWRASSSCASTSWRMNGLAASSPCVTTASVGFCAPAWTRSHAFSPASASTIMIAMSSAPSSVTTLRPATAMSNTACSSCDCFGNATHWPSIRAMRTPPIGPENGRPPICVDALAALIASVS
jgi:hypothetical protein